MKQRTASDSPALCDLSETGPDFSLELEAKRRGQWPVAGTDEAGRGPHLPAKNIRIKKTV